MWLVKDLDLGRLEGMGVANAMIMKLKRGWHQVQSHRRCDKKSSGQKGWERLAAGAAKSFQSCPTLCDPTDGSTRLSHPWDSPGKNSRVGCHFLLQCMKMKSESEVAQSCPTLSDPMNCSLPGSSMHGIFQARVLEWVAIAFSERGLKMLHYWLWRWKDGLIRIE